MAQLARAIGNISRQTGSKKPMPLVTTEEGRNIIGLEGELDMKKVLVFQVEEEEPKLDKEGNIPDFDEKTGKPIVEDEDE